MVGFYHLGGCQKTRSRGPPLLSTLFDGVKPYDRLHRIRDWVDFAHHHISSTQHIICPTGGTQLRVVEGMNELRMANQSPLIVFSCFAKDTEKPFHFYWPSPTFLKALWSQRRVGRLAQSFILMLEMPKFVLVHPLSLKCLAQCLPCLSL